MVGVKLVGEIVWVVEDILNCVILGVVFFMVMV